jgi:glycosyltransferase involved in cell wall biosynthesis
MNKNKVLLVNGSAPSVRCGVGVYSRQLFQKLAPFCTVFILTTSDANTEPAGNTYTVPNWKLRSLPSMRSATIQSGANIVHVQYPAVGYKRELGINLLPLLLRVTTTKKVVVTLHEYYGSARLGKIRNIITALFAHKIIVSNEYDKQAMPFFIRRKTTVIRIGHTIKKYKQNKHTFTTALTTAEFSATTPTIAYFGFVNPSKGIDMLVQAMPNIPAQLILMCELSSNEPYHSKVLERIAAARAKGARIWVAGYTNDKTLSEILQECTLFVLPQPLPLTAKSSTAVVAAEHGLPIVATAAANSTYNQPFTTKNSVLLPTMSVQSLEAACTKLLTHPKTLQELKTHNPELVRHFSWQHIATQHSELYDSLA